MTTTQYILMIFVLIVVLFIITKLIQLSREILENSLDQDLVDEQKRIPFNIYEKVFEKEADLELYINKFIGKNITKVVYYHCNFIREDIPL